MFKVLRLPLIGMVGSTLLFGTDIEKHRPNAAIHKTLSKLNE
ncbi:Uncharacterised protein [Vibrio cholerae]|nr:Uncharacterised protein [Vibrio cholerae]